MVHRGLMGATLDWGGGNSAVGGGGNSGGGGQQGGGGGVSQPLRTALHTISIGISLSLS